MARDRSPKCKQCRREGMKLFLKGERCLTEKCAIERRSYPPGEHGRGRIKQSEYLLQLREKQKARRYYGILEKQFRNYYEKAAKASGITGEELLRMLETRLDNVVRQGGFGLGPASARQIIVHGMVIVNGRKVDRPSYSVRPGDVVTFTTKEKPRKFLAEVLEKTKAFQNPPSWIERNEETFSLKVLQLPAREEFPFQIREQLIVEGASK